MQARLHISVPNTHHDRLLPSSYLPRFCKRPLHRFYKRAVTSLLVGNIIGTLAGFLLNTSCYSSCIHHRVTVEFGSANSVPITRAAIGERRCSAWHVFSKATTSLLLYGRGHAESLCQVDVMQDVIFSMLTVNRSRLPRGHFLTLIVCLGREPSLFFAQRAKG